MKNKRGFSILETIIIVAIFVLILSSGFLLISNKPQRAELEYTSREIVSFIDKARSYASAGYLGDNWGIKVIDNSTTCDEAGASQEDCLVLFKGNDFYASETSTKQYYRLANSSVYFDSDSQNEYYFEYISGWMSSTTASISDQTLVLKSTIDTQRTVTTTVSTNTYFGQTSQIVSETPPLVSTELDSYSESNYATLAALYSGNWIIYGQSFTSSVGGELDSVKFYLKKTGTPPGNMTATIYAHTGTYGSSSKGTGPTLATSDAISASTLSTSFGLVTFDFSGAERITLSASTYYVVALEYSSGDGSNRVDIGIDNTSPTHSGNRAGYTSGWASNSGQDTIFYVYTMQ